MPALGEVGTQIGSMVGGMAGIGQGVMFLLLLLAIVVIFASTAVIMLSIMKFNYECHVYSRTKSGTEVRKLQGGLIKNPKTRKYEFRIRKPRWRVNNFDRDYVFIRKGALGLKRVVHLWQSSDDKVIQLNAKFYQDEKGENGVLVFHPKQLGSIDFEEDFDRHTEEMWDIRTFLDKHGTTIIWGGMLMTMIIINLMALNG